MNTKSTVNKLVKAGLFIALSIVLTRLLSFQVGPFLRIGFGQLPIILSGIILGPLIGFSVGAIADLLGFALGPAGGVFIPGLTLSAALVGFIPGFLCKYAFKKTSTLSISTGIAINGFIVNLLHTTFWLSITFGGYSFVAVFPSRLINQLVMVPINILLVLAIIRLPIFRHDIFNYSLKSKG